MTMTADYLGKKVAASYIGKWDRMDERDHLMGGTCFSRGEVSDDCYDEAPEDMPEVVIEQAITVAYRILTSPEHVAKEAIKQFS